MIGSQPVIAPSVAIGDSLTHDWERSSSAFFERQRLVNRGVCGEVSRQVAARFGRDVLFGGVVAVAILVGTNDIAGNGGPFCSDATLGSIAAMAGAATDAGVVPILCTLPPASHFWWNPAIDPVGAIVALNRRIEDLAAAEALVLADYHGVLRSAAGAIEPRFTSDGVHLTRAGYEQIEPVLAEALARARGMHGRAAGAVRSAMRSTSGGGAI